MSSARDPLSELAYAVFALEQPLTLVEIAAGAADSSLPALATHTPQWFAAAAMGSDLLSIAPELREIPEDESPGERDLIRVYAPEMSELEELDDVSDEPVKATAASVDMPEAPIRIDLLRELSDLDD